jgi:hypothetical protein
MKIALLALAGAAVVVTAAPADARRYSNMTACAKYRHGKCVQWKRLTRAQARGYRVGYRFGPDYRYTAYSALPRTYVTRYRLSPNQRYVYRGNTIYVVDPATYAVTRVLNSIR